jgi:STE24 endopeptidase
MAIPPAARERAAAAALGVVAAGAAALVVDRLRRRLADARPPGAPPARLEDHFDAAVAAGDRRFRRVGWGLAAAGAPLGPALAVGAALTGARWRPVLLRAAGGRGPLAGALFGAGLASAGAVTGLPLGLARYGWGRRGGVVVQPLGGWLADRAKGTAIEAAVAGALAAALAALLRRSPRLWPLGLAGIGAGASVGLAALSPVLIEPLFQRTRPLADEGLSNDVLDLARRSGVTARTVLVSDASRRTTAGNAYVSGLGRTRRIVLFDTLIRDRPRPELRFVVAHELAHVARRHVLRATAWSAVLGVPACAGLAALVGWRTGFGRPDPELVLRRLALIAAGAAVAGPLAAPFGAWASRAYEREADWSALVATGDPDGAVAAIRSLVTQARGVPDPPRWVQGWLGTHPTPLERIGAALAAGGRRPG